MTNNRQLEERTRYGLGLHSKLVSKLVNLMPTVEAIDALEPVLMSAIASTMEARRADLRLEEDTAAFSDELDELMATLVEEDDDAESEQEEVKMDFQITKHGFLMDPSIKDLFFDGGDADE